MKLAINLIMLTLLFTAPCFALNVEWPKSVPLGPPVKGSVWKYIYTDYDGSMKRCEGITWVQHWSFGPPTTTVDTNCQ